MLEETEAQTYQKRYISTEFSFLQGIRELENNLDPHAHGGGGRARIPIKRLQTLLGQSLRWKAEFHNDCLLGKDPHEQERLIEKSISRVLGINKCNSLHSIVQLTFQWRAQGAHNDQPALALESLVELAYGSKFVMSSEGKAQEFGCVPEILTLLMALRTDSQEPSVSVRDLPISKQLINRLMSRRSMNSAERMQFSSEDRRIWGKLSEKHGAAIDNDFHKGIPSK